MTWLRLDDKFAEHPKLLALGGRADRWTWLEVLLYCARQQKRGEVPGNIGDVVRGATPAFLERAQSLGLLELREGRLWIHDFAEYNGGTIDERAEAYLEDHPQASATEVARAIGGRKQLVIEAVRRIQRFPAGSQMVPERTHGSRSGSQSGSLNRTTRAGPTPTMGTKEPHSDSTLSLDSAPAVPSLASPDPDESENERRAAWIRYAEQADHVKAPAAYARTGFESGEWPPETSRPVDPLTLCTNIINGYGWDDTVTWPDLLEECERRARTAGAELNLENTQLEQLEQTWQQLRAERYPEVTA